MKKKFSFVYVMCFLAVLIFMYLYLQLYLVLKRNTAERETTLSYESILCGNLSVNMMSYTRRKCSKQGITTYVEGSLTNHMWQYANVLAISLELGLEGYIPMCLKNSLQSVFTNLTLPLLADISHCDIPLREVNEPVEEWKTLEDIRVIRPTVFNEDIIMKHIDVIRRHFVVKERLSDFASRILLGAMWKDRNATRIGMYISNREGETEVTDPEHSDVPFILSAMDKYREEYKNSFFIVVTRDSKDWEKVLGTKDVCVLNQYIWTRPTVAIALLSQCPHSIILDYEFGPWTTILSGGDAIVSFSLNERLNPMVKFFDKWRYLVGETQYELP